MVRQRALALSFVLCVTACGGLLEPGTGERDSGVEGDDAAAVDVVAGDERDSASDGGLDATQAHDVVNEIGLVDVSDGPYAADARDGDDATDGQTGGPEASMEDASSDATPVADSDAGAVDGGSEAGETGTACSWTLTQKQQPSTGTGDTYSVAAGDLNGDGRLDLVTGDGPVGVFLGDGDGTFRPQLSVTAGVAPRGMAIGDLNEDGKADIVAPNFGYGSAGTVSVLLGNGDGTFKPQVTYATGVDPYDAAIGDVNGDGFSDLAIANFLDATVSVLLGNGDGTFQAQKVFRAGIAVDSVVLGDLNHDEKLDIMVADARDINGNGGLTIGVLLGKGDGTFASPVYYASGSETKAVALGDLDLDGNLDVAVAGYGYATVLLGNGDGTLQAYTQWPTGDAVTSDGASSVAIVDVDLDGRLDLVLASPEDNLVNALLGNGDGTFQPPRTFPAGAGPYFVATGDFDGNGYPDVAVADSNAPQLTILLGGCE